MKSQNPEPKKLTIEQRDKAIDEFCAEVDRLLGLSPSTKEELDRAMAESTTLVMYPRTPKA
jgi:hypothetical protein